MSRARHLALLTLFLAGDVVAADAARGRVLYETRCTGCHATSVHGRQNRVATTCAAIRTQVQRWNGNLGATWSEEEVDDVALWLNERYYRLPVENGRCVTPVAALRPRP